MPLPTASSQSLYCEHCIACLWSLEAHAWIDPSNAQFKHSSTVLSRFKISTSLHTPAERSPVRGLGPAIRA
eukprot:4133965-Heterocapsa_arctica.AAC.1